MVGLGVGLPHGRWQAAIGVLIGVRVDVGLSEEAAARVVGWEEDWGGVVG